MAKEKLLIGELARRAGVRRETLRYYERRGLLKPARRTSSGYRLYGRDSEERLRFIRRAQSFGFTLDEISVLLGLRVDSPRSCRRVAQILQAKLEDIARKLEELTHFQQQLTHYREECLRALDRGDVNCPVIEDVSQRGRPEAS